MESRYFSGSDLVKRKWLIEKVKEMSRLTEKEGKCVRQAGIVARENKENGKMEEICSAGDNRVDNNLEHCVICLINKASGVGDYILTGLEGEIRVCMRTLTRHNN